MKRWIGVDPGQKGALAIVDSEGGVEVLDYPGNSYGLSELIFGLTLAPGRIESVVVEEIGALPKKMRGVSASASLNQNFGGWEMIMAVVGWPVRFIRPSDWKRGLGYPKGDYAKSKAHSVALACKLYPEHSSLFYGPRGGGKDGRAEAVLLAHFAAGRKF